MTALSPAAETMIRQRIAAHAVNISGLFDLLKDLRTARDDRASQVTAFMSLLNDLIEEGGR